jgi:hypothetical protein
VIRPLPAANGTLVESRWPTLFLGAPSRDAPSLDDVVVRPRTRESLERVLHYFAMPAASRLRRSQRAAAIASLAEMVPVQRRE